jgi:hypothetical protein
MNEAILESMIIVHVSQLFTQMSSLIVDHADLRLWQAKSRFPLVFFPFFPSVIANACTSAALARQNQTQARTVSHNHTNALVGVSPPLPNAASCP